MQYNQIPTMSLVAKKFVALPATQTTSERLFFLSGNIIIPIRAKLISQNVEQLSFLHYHLEKILLHLKKKIYMYIKYDE